MPDAPKTRIFVKQIRSIGFVDRGANSGADVIMFKRSGDAVDTNAEKVGRKMAGARLAQLKDALTKLTALLGELEDSAEEDSDMSDKKDEKQPTDAEKLEAAEKRAAELEAKAAALEAQVAELSAKRAEPEDVWKGVSAEVRKRIEDAEKRAQDAELAAKAERDARELSEETAKIRTELPALSVKAEEFAVVLKHAREKLDFADACELGRVLKATNEQLKQSKLFGEVGRTANDNGESASAKIEAKAVEIRKANPKLSPSAARVEARKQLPDIARQERDEKNAR